MRYYAHRFGDDGDRSKWQPLEDHLLAVADLTHYCARDALFPQCRARHLVSLTADPRIPTPASKAPAIAAKPHIETGIAAVRAATPFHERGQACLT